MNGQLLTDQEIDQLGVRGAYPHFNEQLYLQQFDQCREPAHRRKSDDTPPDAIILQNME
ncbi:MAG: hypothetical protein JXB05_32775 [Myxococcaceae bacterium]|nr:hypothetical protein [Myxococcaceae bacterium]